MMSKSDKEKHEDKMYNLKSRIMDIQMKISELQESKICLMMLKRDIMMDYTKQTLENCFTDEMKRELEKINLFETDSDVVTKQMVVNLLNQNLKDVDDDELKDTLLENPFDEKYPAKEERYWAADMVKKGKTYMYVPTIECKHHWTPNGSTWKGIG